MSKRRRSSERFSSAKNDEADFWLTMKDCVPLTDQLIDELVRKGPWELADMKSWQKMGYLYNPLRGTVVSPITAEGF